MTQSGTGYAATFMGGSVGIGTTTPSGKLEVRQDATAAGQVPAVLILHDDADAATYNWNGTAIEAVGHGGAPEFEVGAQWDAGSNSNSNFFIANNKGGTLSTFMTARHWGAVGFGIAPTAGFDIQSPTTYQTTNIYGTRIQQSLQAGAANDSLTALFVNPTFNDNGQTGVTHNGLIVSSGNVGIGTVTPASKLNVSGAIVSVPSNVAAGAAVDLSLSNTITLAAVGGSAITLSNMVHGGTYTLVIQDTTSRTYTFSGCNTTKFKPANAATTSGTQSIYTVLTVYNGATYDCYVTWATGYQ